MTLKVSIATIAYSASSLATAGLLVLNVFKMFRPTFVFSEIKYR